MNQQQRFKENQKIAETGIFLALFLGLAYIFLYIPNFEFITFISFLSTLLFGFRRGLFISVVGEVIFAVFNPMGSSLAYPYLFAAQLLGMVLIVMVAFLSKPLILTILNKKRILMLLLGGIGFLLSFSYDTMTSLSFPLASGFNTGQIWASYLAGIPFYLIHIISNTLIFMFILPAVIQYIFENFSRYGSVSRKS